MSDFVKCPVWCKRDCKVKHHPLLVALLNCVDTDDEQQIEQQLSDLEHVVLKYEQNSSWKRTLAIPDETVTYRFPMLHWACVLGHMSALSWLVLNGVPATLQTVQGDTGIHRALLSLQESILVHRKNIVDKFKHIIALLGKALKIPNKMGRTPLHLACELVREHSSRDSTNTLLIKTMLAAAEKESPEFLHGFVNHQTPSGDTALHIVCRGLLNFQDKNLITVKNLLKFGADINILNKKHLSPLDLAIQYGQFKTSQVLNDAGTKRRRSNSPSGKATTEAGNSTPQAKKQKTQANGSSSKEKDKQEERDKRKEKLPMCTSCSSVIRPGDPHTECWIHLGRDHTCSKCEETGSFMGFPSFRHYLQACYSGEGFPSGSGGKGPSPEKSGSHSDLQQDTRDTSVSKADKNGAGNAVNTREKSLAARGQQKVRQSSRVTKQVQPYTDSPAASRRQSVGKSPPMNGNTATSMPEMPASTKQNPHGSTTAKVPPSPRASATEKTTLSNRSTDIQDKNTQVIDRKPDLSGRDDFLLPSSAARHSAISTPGAEAAEHTEERDKDSCNLSSVSASSEAEPVLGYLKFANQATRMMFLAAMKKDLKFYEKQLATHILKKQETEHALECHEDRLHRKQEQIKALLANLVRQQEEEVAMQKLVDNTLASITDDQQQLHLLEEKLQQCTNAIETIEKI